MARAGTSRISVATGRRRGRRTGRVLQTLAALALALGWPVASPLPAQPPSSTSGPAEPAPAWPTSPWHGVIDGNGERIPCRCRFAGREWRLGDLVCMTTHVGTVLARCDLNLNNTSWVPTATPCELSLAPPAEGAARTLAAGLR